MSLHAQSVLGHGRERRAFVIEAQAAAMRVATTYLAHWASKCIATSHEVGYRPLSGTLFDARLNRFGALLCAAAMRCDDAQKALSDAFIKRVRADACPDDIADEAGNGIFDCLSGPTKR